MLRHLSIRDVVVIKELDIEFQSGMTALTGETGSGKSILLDALGLALGGRADSAMIRQGADKASVCAEFSTPKNGLVLDLLSDQSIDCDNDTIILRRILQADGKSRAFINDQPVSVQLLKQIGAQLVEIHGQFDQHGLLNRDTHLQTLDDFAGLKPQSAQLRDLYANWQTAMRDYESAVATQKQKQSQEQYLRHAAGELRAFDPKAGEEQELAERRIALQHREKLQSAFAAAIESLGGEDGADRGILAAQKSLGRVADKLPALIDPILDGLERAAIELREAIDKIHAATREDGDAPAQLESLEDRLFAIRELARKYDVQPDQLAELRDQMMAELDAIDTADSRIESLYKAATQSKQKYADAAQKLSAARIKAAKKLDKAVGDELEPLKLGRAKFMTNIETLADDQWGAFGIDRVEFQISTNPGMPAGPLSKIASGGELSRVMLAIKVVLAESQNSATLIFDEIDTGVSGGVADAVGSRLEKLGGGAQILLVTHSPQVAAKAHHHYRISKSMDKNSTQTQIDILNAKTRREELAKMLSGASITDEARAQADRLLGAA
jgi:DNA repair protein RecN (Recombination protein N)